MKTQVAFLALAVLCSVRLAWAADGAGATQMPAVTKPSVDVVLEFTHPGRVAEMMVKDGDTVTAGQVVAQQDDTEEKAAFDVAQAQADDNTRYEAQVKVCDQKEKVYDHKKKSEAASLSEVEEALVDWEVAKANVRLSAFEHVQDGRKALQAKATWEKTRLRSPVAGHVEQTMVKVGESVDSQNMKVMRIVNIDPLWIEVPVPFSVARDLKNDAGATVLFSNKEKREGKVIHVASVADAASDTLLVRVEVQNTAKTQAGERVTVSFPAPVKSVGEVVQPAKLQGGPEVALETPPTLIMVRPKIIIQKEIENNLFGVGYDKPVGLPSPDIEGDGVAPGFSPNAPK